MDGARLFNASVKLGVDPSKIVERCDSVSLCLSKVRLSIECHVQNS